MMRRLMMMQSLLAAFLMLLCCSGCQTKTDGFVLNPETAETAACVLETTAPVVVETYQLPYLEGYSAAGSIAGEAGRICYSCCIPSEQLSTVDDSRLFSLDLGTGDDACILHVQGEPHWINELAMAGGRLFGVLRTGASVGIFRVDEETNAYTMLREYPSSHPDILLAGGGDYNITWFEFGAADELAALYAYDTASDTVFTVSDRVAIQSPFERAYPLDGVTAFIEREGDSRFLCVYDFAGDELPTWLQANRDFVRWKDPETGEGYFYIPAQERLLRLDSGEDVQIFSLHLMGDLVVVNDSMSGEILGVRPLDGVRYLLSDPPESSSLYYTLGTSVSSDSCIFADGRSNTILRLSTGE